MHHALSISVASHRLKHDRKVNILPETSCSNGKEHSAIDRVRVAGLLGSSSYEHNPGQPSCKGEQPNVYRSYSQQCLLQLRLQLFQPTISRATNYLYLPSPALSSVVSARSRLLDEVYNSNHPPDLTQQNQGMNHMAADPTQLTHGTDGNEHMALLFMVLSQLHPDLETGC